MPKSSFQGPVTTLSIVTGSLMLYEKNTCYYEVKFILN